MNFTDPELNRMRWQCRRGMLELDLLLTDFLETRFPNLDPSARQSFLRLLELPDQTLQQWLFGDGAKVDSELQQIVRILKDHGAERC